MRPTLKEFQENKRSWVLHERTFGYIEAPNSIKAVDLLQVSIFLIYFEVFC